MDSTGALEDQLEAVKVMKDTIGGVHVRKSLLQPPSRQGQKILL